MRRRQFFGVLGGAAFTWPLAAAGQQERIRRVSVLMGIAEGDPEGQARIAAFQTGMRSVTTDVQVDVRWAGGDQNRTAAHVRDIVDSAPHVILATNTATAKAFQRATTTIPIIFVSVS